MCTTRIWIRSSAISIKATITRVSRNGMNQRGIKERLELLWKVRNRLTKSSLRSLKIGSYFSKKDKSSTFNY